MLQPAEVMIDRRHFGVIGAERPFDDLKRSPIETLGLIKIARVFVEHGQIVADGRDFKMVRPEGRICQFKRTQVKWLGFGVLAVDAEPVGALAQSIDQLFLFGPCGFHYGAHSFSLALLFQVSRSAVFHWAADYNPAS